jgi:uncharacterized protein (TIGR03435 family)
MNLRLGPGVIVCFALAAIVGARALCAQGAVPDWQSKIGGKMEFDMASVRQDKGPFTPPSFALSPDDAYIANTDALNADFPLSVYIEFAYKLWLTSDQRHTLYDPLPKWVTTDRYMIRAKADHPVTKDQMRLMMQTLLAERFGLKLHFENKEAEVILMTLTKPGVLGPRLRPAAEAACAVVPSPPPVQRKDPKTMSADEIPWTCNYTLVPRPGKMMLGGSRSTTTELIAEFLGSLASNFGLVSRPVVDQTGLTGKYDFTIEFAQPQRPGADSGPDAEQSAPAGPDLMEAAQEQLGLRFKPGKAVLSMPVIDHVDRPLEN